MNRLEEEKEYINNKILDAFEALNLIKDKFKKRCKVSLCVTILNPGLAFLEHGVNIFSADVNRIDLQNFIGYLDSRLKELEDAEKFIEASKMTVYCKNCKNLPKKLKQPLLAGNLYKVTKVLINKKGKAQFQIEGINDDRGYTALSSTRFQIISQTSTS